MEIHFYASQPRSAEGIERSGCASSVRLSEDRVKILSKVESH